MQIFNGLKTLMFNGNASEPVLFPGGTAFSRITPGISID
jgi:hypothetical protein